MSESTDNREGELVILVGEGRTPIPTGLRGLWSPIHGEFYLPFSDEDTAEEVGRIVTGQVRRGRAS